MKIELNLDFDAKTITGHTYLNDKKVGCMATMEHSLPLTLYTELMTRAIFQKAVADGHLTYEQVFPQELIANEN